MVFLPGIIQYISTVVSTLTADAPRCGLIPRNGWSGFVEWTWVQKLTSLAWIWLAKRSLSENIAYLVYGPYLLCCPEALFTIRQSGPWQRKRNFEAIFVSASGK